MIKFLKISKKNIYKYIQFLVYEITNNKYKCLIIVSLFKLISLRYKIRGKKS